MFAKLFDTKIGQILVKNDQDDEGKPEVRYYFEPEDLGVCSLALTFDDNEAGWAKADEAFEKTDADVALAMVRRIVDALSD